MSPLGAVTMSFGSVSASGGAPATPALPSRISTLPSGLNLITWWPTVAGVVLGGCPRAACGRLSFASVTQMLPSRST